MRRSEEVGDKVCGKCKKKKSFKDFSKNKSKKDGHNNTCKLCIKNNYKKDYDFGSLKEKRKIFREKTSIKNRIKVFDYLSEMGCVDCGEKDVVVLQFDHKDESKKTAGISSMIRGSCWDTIKKEIDKCDVRCANCHARRTSKQQNWYDYLSEDLKRKYLIY